MAHINRVEAERIADAVIEHFGKHNRTHRAFIIDAALSGEVNNQPDKARAAAILVAIIGSRVSHRAPT